MVRNPYVAALVRHQDATRHLLPANATSAGPTVPERVQAFFDAMEINHGGNRARVCTAIAHTMTRHEIDEAIRRLWADANGRADYLANLNAPEVIVTNERRKHDESIRLLERVRPKRPV